MHGFSKNGFASLLDIAYGNTKSYAVRALANANANGTNKISIIISCHRVISSDAKLTGYAGRI